MYKICCFFLKKGQFFTASGSFTSISLNNLGLFPQTPACDVFKTTPTFFQILERHFEKVTCLLFVSKLIFILHGYGVLCYVEEHATLFEQLASPRGERIKEFLHHKPLNQVL